MRALSMVLRVGLVVGAWVGLRSADPAAAVLLLSGLLASLLARLAPPREELLFTGGLCGLLALAALGVLPDHLGGDLVVHGVASALLALVLLRGLLPRTPAPAARHGLLALLLVGLVGVAWEGAEALADAWLGTQMSLGATDTASDLVADLVGAATVIRLLAASPALGVAA
ncbi:hypothetical protein [Paraconexibacter algicola]|nr:hypothetical protein [Paraconexibacter algicola]